MENVEQVQSIKAEISKQLQNKKALQRGVLWECNICQTVANMLGMNCFCDLEIIESLPIELERTLYKIQEKVGKPRYVYYKKGCTESVLYQCGSPTSVGDALLISGDTELILEIKNVPALFADKDLVYNEEGKLTITTELEQQYPYFIEPIKQFNKETTIFDDFGVNYRILETMTHQETSNIIDKIFLTTLVDIVLTTDKQDKLVAFTEKQMKTPNLIDYAKSEIRTTGKNHQKVFTPEYLDKVLLDKGISDINGICRISKENNKIIGLKKGRGTNKISRLKLNHCFFVPIKDVEESLDSYTFKKQKIKQSKSGISIHINLQKTKEEIISVLGISEED